jgi:hypothetical protein
MPPIDPSQLAQDKDFMGADPEEQMKFLSSQDQDFAKAPREDQMGYLEHLTGKPVRPNVGLAPPAGAPPTTKEFANKLPSPKPSTLDVITQPTEKTDKEYLGYTGPAGVAGATIKGADDIGRGVQGAITGMRDTFMRPIETVKSIAGLPRMAAQVPAAVRDINASADPTGRYLDAAQDTASQGAGQALTALGTMGAGRFLKPAIRLGARAAEAAINQKLVPIRPIMNLSTPADEAANIRLRVPGRDLGLTKPMYPGAPEPAVPPRDFLQRNVALQNPAYPGAPLPEAPLKYPGAPFPEKPPSIVMKAVGLRTGGRVPVDESAVLGKLPATPAEPEPMNVRPKGKMGGRYVLTPEEAKAMEQIQKVAALRASQRGMQYAAGMKPSGAKIPTP